MKDCPNRLLLAAILFPLAWSPSNAFALVDNAQLVSVSVPVGATIKPRTVFTQIWTMQNTGTTTWSPTSSGTTLNLAGKDSLGCVPLFTNTSSKWHIPSAIIGSGKSVAPGGQAVYSLTFIAPESPGTFTDTFQLNGAAGTNFGPMVTVQIVVSAMGSTNQYDRARAVSYANNYEPYICSDGYFWTNGSGYGYFGALAPVPTNVIGDDCAHFVSSCIGSQPGQRGGGLTIPSRVPPTYGEPGAGRLINTVLIAGGYAAEVSSLNSMEPGDLVGWNWEGDTNIANLDHVTLYVGNGLLASHAASALDVSANTWYQSSEPKYVRHLIHIFDAPTLGMAMNGKKMVLSWGTNWTGYSLYSSTSLGSNAAWTKVSTTPTKVGPLNMVTNVMGSSAVFYQLILPSP